MSHHHSDTPDEVVVTSLGQHMRQAASPSNLRYAFLGTFSHFYTRNCKNKQIRTHEHTLISLLYSRY